MTTSVDTEDPLEGVSSRRSQFNDTPSAHANHDNERGATRNSGPATHRTIPVADIFNARNQLSEAFFHRIATGYARIFPLTARRIIEFGFLLQAFFVLGVLIYLHSMFVRSPITCLDKLRSQPVVELEDALSLFTRPEPIARNHYAPGDPRSPREPWPRYGILRIEVIRKPNPKYSLEDSYAKEFYDSALDHSDEVNEFMGLGSSVSEDGASTTPAGAGTFMTGSSQFMPVRQKLSLHDPRHFWNALRSVSVYIFGCIHETLELILGLFSIHSSTTNSVQTSPDGTPLPSHDYLHLKRNIFLDCLSYMGAFFTGVSSTVVQFFRDVASWFRSLHVSAHEDNYIIEYALEYGLLRLSAAMRNRLNITVKLVVLDPDVDACFGGPLSQFLMDEFLGYDDLLLGSIKHLAVSESVRGHMANVVTGQHYRLVSVQMSRSSYLVATLVMLLFTFCVSTILRYSTHQLVLVIADILQLFETNVAIGIPATPFMTVILALVAIETIMSEFFGDSFTAFYVILIVSICDHFEAVFCRTEISRRYWPRFFYLYHFAFYAYHYRFNGQFSSMALWVSWLFTLHSMIYFFHHYELPNLLNGWELRDLLTQIASEGHTIRSIQIEVRRQQPQQPMSDTTEVLSGTGSTSTSPSLSMSVSEHSSTDSHIAVAEELSNSETTHEISTNRLSSENLLQDAGPTGDASEALFASTVVPKPASSESSALVAETSSPFTSLENSEENLNV